MKILFLTISGRNGASSRYRVYQYLPLLERAGYEVSLIPPAARKGSSMGRLIAGLVEEQTCLNAARRADIVFIQKRLFSRGFLRRLDRLNKKLVFDIDDSVFTSPKGDWSLVTRLRVISRLSMVFNLSDLVLAGNAYLESYAEESGARRVEVLPTPINTQAYALKDHLGGGPPVLGWIGSSVNHAYLDLLSGVLPVLAGEFPDLKLLVVSNAEYRMPGVRVENLPWSEETEVQHILNMDIGLMPLRDDRWTRGKCALKALQYMACGIPAACSPVGANLEVVQEGVDGYLPGDDDGWLDALRNLITSPATRASMGAAARLKVQADYSLARAGSHMLNHLGSL